MIGAVINHFMTRVTNKIVPHRLRKCSFAFRLLVSLIMSLTILKKYLCNVQHYSLYIWIIARIRSRHLDSDPRGRDEISTLNLFKYIFIEHDIVEFSPHI